MERLTEKQFLLLVNGPICGGKSTTIKQLFETYAGLFKVQGDVIKLQISGYVADVQRDVVYEMSIALTQSALSQGLSVIKEGATYQPERYSEIVKQFNIPVYVANISAPWEILVKRWQEREDAKNAGLRAKNADFTRLEVVYNMYLNAKMETPLEFDSSVQSTQEIVDQITQHIKDTI
jgi:chloramphenicol 3-O-phosphotransferase